MKLARLMEQLDRRYESERTDGYVGSSTDSSYERRKICERKGRDGIEIKRFLG